jgi:hypothetical protein
MGCVETAMRGGILTVILSVVAVGAAYGGSLPAHSSHSFTDYSAEVYKGAFAEPDFQHSSKGYWMFRTRIRDGARTGVNFGGHFAITGAGCGTGCIQYFMIDLITGRISDLPVGGEQRSVTMIDGRPDSLLLKATWEAYGKDFASLCSTEDFVYEGTGFRSLGRHTIRGNMDRDDKRKIYVCQPALHEDE